MPRLTMEGLNGDPCPASETEPLNDSGTVSRGWGGGSSLKGENLVRVRAGGFLTSGT